LFCQFVSYNSFVSSIPGNAPPSPFLPSPFLPSPFPPPNGSGRGNVCLLTRRDTVLTGKTDASNEGVVRYIDYPRQATARVVCCPTLHMARPVYVYLYRAAAITGQRGPAVALPTSKHSAVNRSSCNPAPRSTESTLHNRRNVQSFTEHCGRLRYSSGILTIYTTPCASPVHSAVCTHSWRSDTPAVVSWRAASRFQAISDAV